MIVLWLACAAKAPPAASPPPDVAAATMSYAARGAYLKSRFYLEAGRIMDAERAARRALFFSPESTAAAAQLALCQGGPGLDGGPHHRVDQALANGRTEEVEAWLREQADDVQAMSALARLAAATGDSATLAWALSQLPRQAE